MGYIGLLVPEGKGVLDLRIKIPLVKQVRLHVLRRPCYQCRVKYHRALYRFWQQGVRPVVQLFVARIIQPQLGGHPAKEVAIGLLRVELAEVVLNLALVLYRPVRLQDDGIPAQQVLVIAYVLCTVATGKHI